MEKITFLECSLTKLDKWFGIRQVDTMHTLSAWLEMPYVLSEDEKRSLLKLQRKLNKNLMHWNEYELAAHFIGPIFSFVDYTTAYFNDFGERIISATINNIELTGKPDGIIASGFREPEQPFFCFHEYKPETDPYGDPYGQCLAAMLVGQALNENLQPIYGCVVKGADWNFLLLEGKQYTISRRFVADGEMLFDIFRILHSLKAILLSKADKTKPNYE
jgi:hypothetical protein